MNEMKEGGTDKGNMQLMTISIPHRLIVEQPGEHECVPLRCEHDVTQGEVMPTVLVGHRRNRIGYLHWSVVSGNDRGRKRGGRGRKRERERMRERERERDEREKDRKRERRECI